MAKGYWENRLEEKYGYEDVNVVSKEQHDILVAEHSNCYMFMTALKDGVETILGLHETGKNPEFYEVLVLDFNISDVEPVVTELFKKDNY